MLLVRFLIVAFINIMKGFPKDTRVQLYPCVSIYFSFPSQPKQTNKIMRYYRFYSFQSYFPLRKYTILFQLVPCVVLTIFTGFLIRALYQVQNSRSKVAY